MIFKTRGLNYEIENKKILSDMSVEIPKNALTSLVGPNGAGKTTLLKIFSKILKPTAGDVYLEKRNINEIKLKEFSKKVAFLPQNFRLPFSLKVFELVLLSRTPYKDFFAFDSKEDRDVCLEALQKTETLQFKDRYFHTLSGGEQQRVLIAKCLAQKANVLLLDEPNSYLDLSHKINLIKLLLNLKLEQNLSIIITSHDLHFVKSCCDYSILIKNGKIIKSGLTSQTLSISDTAFTFSIPEKILEKHS